MTNRHRRQVSRPGRRIVAVLASLVVSFGIALVPLQAYADTIPTSTMLQISGASYGDPLTFTATVTSESGTPTGSVTFTEDDGDVIAEDVAVDSDGVASVTMVATQTGLTGYHAHFTGTDGYGASSGFSLHNTVIAGMVLNPEPSVLEISKRNPLKINLTLSAYASRFDGSPVVGEPLTFSVLGKQPNLFDFGGGTVICTAVTDADGFASCGGAGLGGAVVSLLAGGSYVTHFRSERYGFSSAKAKVILLGG